MTRRPASSKSRLACCLWLTGLLCAAIPVVAAAVVCSELKFQDARATVCQVSVDSDHLQLYLKDDAGAPFTSFRRLEQALAARGEQLTFAMNAGMYREDYTPVGLLVSEGRQLHRLNMASGYGNFYLKPNGVFVLAASGASIVESSEYRALQDPAMLATQSGPLLVQDGRINPSLNPQGTSRLIRNGVGVVSSTRVVFAISEDPITFYQFALLFRDGLKCADALYLDGNVSSLYVRSLGRDDERVPIGPIIGVTVRTPH